MNKLSPPALRLSSKGDKNCHILRKSDTNCHIFDRTGKFSPTKLKRKPRIDHFDGRWIKRVYDADVWAGLHPKLRSIIQCVRLPLICLTMMGIYSPSK